MHTLQSVLPYLIAVSIAAVLASLFAGLVSMARGGAVNARWGNRLMRARVVAQGATLLLVALYLALLQFA